MEIETLSIIYGTSTSFSLYLLSVIKGSKDVFRGHDTFFARAYIPYLNRILKLSGENPIRNEAEFQEYLRIKRGIENKSPLENTVIEN